MNAAQPVGYIHPNDIDFLQHCIAADKFGTVEASSKPLQRREPIYLHPASPRPPWKCTMGVGCDEAGVCYAAANGQPERCVSRAPTVDAAMVEALWRKCGLPEWFLGNAGSNHKLYEFAAALSPSSGNDSMGEKP